MMDQILRLNELFGQVCNSGADRLNYVSAVELRHSIVSGNRLDEIVKGALGEKAVPGREQSVNASDVLGMVDECLRFEGDEGSHPDVEVLRSAEIQNAIGEIKRLLQELLSESKRITSCCLKEGNPYYPVFWDFAYAIELNDQAYVLIGSASD